MWAAGGMSRLIQSLATGQRPIRRAGEVALSFTVWVSGSLAWVRGRSWRAGTVGGWTSNVHEFAVLDDGRRLTLHQNRGFSTSATHLTAEHVDSSVLTTVLPDDAEIT